MIEDGQVVLFRFPTSDLKAGKLRPALVIRKLPGEYDDWLICMISSQLGRAIQGFDEIVRTDDPDFRDSGLKTESVVRVFRLAVVEREVLLGAVGAIGSERLARIRTTLSAWIGST